MLGECARQSMLLLGKKKLTILMGMSCGVYLVCRAFVYPRSKVRNLLFLIVYGCVSILLLFVVVVVVVFVVVVFSVGVVC